MREPFEENKYWIDSSDRGEERLSVKMKVLINLVNTPVLKSEMKKTLGLENLSIFRQSQGTNFPITAIEWRSIKNLISKLKVD